MSPWLAAAYGALALGLAWSLTSGGDWARRIPFIVGAPALAIALWLGKPDPAGWPTAGALPKHAAVVSALVHEPDPATNDKGRIFLWLDVGGKEPRAFAVPYTRSLHEQVQRALARIAQHRPVGLARASGSSHDRRRLARFTTGQTLLPAKRH